MAPWVAAVALFGASGHFDAARRRRRGFSSSATSSCSLRGTARTGRGSAVLMQCAETAEADVDEVAEATKDSVEEEVEPPTPFPKVKLYPPACQNLLRLTLEEDAEEHEVVEALEILKDFHEFDMQWVEWPLSVEDARTLKYHTGLFILLRGLVRYIRGDNIAIRDAAISLMYSFVVGGNENTRLPPKLTIEVGAFAAACDAVLKGAPSETLAIVREVLVLVPKTKIGTLLNLGLLDAAVHVLEDEVSAPLDLWAALEVLVSLAKRVPDTLVEAGIYDKVKIIDNEALVPKRNKIMNLLRPIVEGERDEEDEEDEEEEEGVVRV